MGDPDPRFFDEYFCGNRKNVLEQAKSDYPNLKQFRPVLLTKEIADAIEVLVKYDWHAEQWDFLGVDDNRQENHVFVSKLILFDWLESQPDYWLDTSVVVKWFACLITFVFFLPEVVWLGRQLIPDW